MLASTTNMDLGNRKLENTDSSLVPSMSLISTLIGITFIVVIQSGI